MTKVEFWRRNWSWMVFVVVGIAVVYALDGLGIMRMVRGSAYVGLVFLIVSLLPKHMLALGIRAGMLRLMIKHRRNAGIAAGLLLIFHASIAVGLYAIFPPPLAFFISRPVLPGTITLIIILAMLTTSSKVAPRLLGKYWKTLHTLVWVTVPFATVHAVLVRSVFAGQPAVLGAVVFGGIIGFVVLEMIVWKMRGRIPPSVVWRARHIMAGAIGSILYLLLV